MAQAHVLEEAEAEAEEEVMEEEEVMVMEEEEEELVDLMADMGEEEEMEEEEEELSEAVQACKDQVLNLQQSHVFVNCVNKMIRSKRATKSKYASSSIE